MKMAYHLLTVKGRQNIVPYFLQIKVNILLNLCNYNDQTLSFQCINVRQVCWEMLKTSGFKIIFNISIGTW